MLSIKQNQKTKQKPKQKKCNTLKLPVNEKLREKTGIGLGVPMQAKFKEYHMTF